MGRWVICGVGRGRNDRHTLKAAAEAADSIGARLAIVMVLPESSDRDALAAGRCAVADLARRCAVVDDAVHCVQVGDPAEELARLSEEFNADVVVVGRTRATGLKSLLRAGVAARLSRRIERPVAVVPPAARGADVVRGLAPTPARGRVAAAG